MKFSSSAKPLHFLVRTIGLVVLYMGTAQLGFLAAISPGNVTIVWPPSGLAVAAVMIYGYRTGLGIWLGSFLINLWSLGGGPTAGVIAASIASGSTVQALAAAFLLLRWIGPFPSAPSPKDLIKFASVTALACVIAATIGVTSLTLGGLVNPDNYFFTWTTWWLGDELGIIIFTPLLLVIHRWLNGEMVAQQVIPIMLGLGVGFGLFLFAIIYSQETRAIAAELKIDSQIAAAQFKNTIQIGLHDLDSLSSLHQASTQVSRREFQTFVEPDLHGLLATPGIQALEWLPRVPDAQRADYEAAARQDGLSGFRFIELDEQGKRVPAGSRAEYFPVYYVEPLVGNEAALGFDVASEPTRYETLAHARDSGQTLATPPITLIQEQGQQKALVIFQPVYRKGEPTDTVAARRRHLLGFVVGVFRLGDLLTASVDSYHHQTGLDFYLFEKTTLLGVHPAHPRTEPLQVNNNFTPAGLQGGWLYAKSIELLGRRWQLIAQPTPEYISSRRTWTPWAGMGALVAFTGLVVFYIRQRQRTERTLIESQKQYRLLAENISDVIWILDLETMRFTYVSPSVERLRGYTPDQVLAQHLTEVLTPASLQYFQSILPERLDEFKAGRQAYYIDTIENLCHDGTTVWTENMAHFHVNEDTGHIEAYGVARDITARRQAEAALRESTEHFRATFDQAFVGIAHVAPDGCWLQVNQKLCDIVGYTKEELLQRTYGDITHPDDHAADQEMIRQVLANKLQTYVREKRYVRKDGSVVWINLIASVVWNPSGQLQYFISIIQDITARRQAEAEIQRRNRELALLNQVIAASASGLEAEEVLNIACHELALAFDMPQATATLLTREKTAAQVVAEYRATGRPSALGAIIPIGRTPASQYALQTHGPLMVNDTYGDARLGALQTRLCESGVTALLLFPLHISGEMVGSLSLESLEPRTFSTEEINLAWSVADQVAGALARARLVQTQQRLSTVVEQSEQSVMITDTKGDIIYINPAFERNSGYSRAEVMGRNPRLLKSNQHDTAFYAELWATISAGQVWRGQFVNKKKNGALYIEEASITPVRDENGGITCYVGLQRDITRELQLEEQYRQAQKMEAVGRLSGGVAHDFNNLLVVINGYSELLLNRHFDESNPLRKYVEEIMMAGERAAGLTQQLLAFSRKQILQPKVLNLNETVAQTEKMLRRLIGEDIDLVTQFQPDLGEVKADPGQIEQIILNLGVNARDAMPRGGKLIIETANVELDQSYTSQHVEVKPGHYVMLAVSDTGQGMDAATKARIFEPFFTTKGEGQGTGLGLATVYGIVKQSGGDIWVYSEVGQGTTFKVYLPRVGEAEPQLEPPPDSSAELPGGTETVLLVEDENKVRALARQVLEFSGYTVLEAEHGQAALRLAEQQQSIHLLLTDLIMPNGLTGRELAEQLEPLHPEMKVLYMSGYTDEIIAQHGVLLEGVNFLEKPFTISSLTHQVRQALVNSRTQF